MLWLTACSGNPCGTQSLERFNPPRCPVASPVADRMRMEYNTGQSVVLLQDYGPFSAGDIATATGNTQLKPRHGFIHVGLWELPSVTAWLPCGKHRCKLFRQVVTQISQAIGVVDVPWRVFGKRRPGKSKQRRIRIMMRIWREFAALRPEDCLSQ